MIGRKRRFKDMTGEKFGRLIALEFLRVDDKRRAVWSFKCDCGAVKEAPANQVRYGHIVSCGCALRENLARGTYRHGMTGSPAWKAWLRMKNRCEQPSAQRYRNYGGRGISICERWKTFEHFFEDMGTPPPGYSLERNDVNGNYSKENCRWVARDEQYSNTTRTIYVRFHGVNTPFRDLVRKSGLNYETAYARLKRYGWTPERIFTNLKPEGLHEVAAKLSGK